MFSLKIDTGNAAFTDESANDDDRDDDAAARAECARIMRELADRLENGSEEAGKVYDANGNHVGAWKVTP